MPLVGNLPTTLPVFTSCSTHSKVNPPISHCQASSASGDVSLIIRSIIVTVVLKGPEVKCKRSTERNQTFYTLTLSPCILMHLISTLSLFYLLARLKKHITLIVNLAVCTNMMHSLTHRLLAFKSSSSLMA